MKFFLLFFTICFVSINVMAQQPLDPKKAAEQKAKLQQQQIHQQQQKQLQLQQQQQLEMKKMQEQQVDEKAKKAREELVQSKENFNICQEKSKLLMNDKKKEMDALILQQKADTAKKDPAYFKKYMGLRKELEMKYQEKRKAVPECRT